MVINKDISLAQYSTMRLGGSAHHLCEVLSEADFEKALVFAKERKLKIHIIGGGSNTIFGDEGFKGLVIINKISGCEIDTQKDSIVITSGGGEPWDNVVSKSVEHGYVDIAALSMIPGSAGGAPVQNIGAYGQQISDVIESIRVYDMQKKAWLEIEKNKCEFGYRSSRFNTTDKERFFVSFIKMRLSRKTANPPFYADVERYFELHNIPFSDVDGEKLREAVMAVRGKKLPDPSVVANTGSFFKNPVIEESQYQDLLVHYPTLKSHRTDDGKLKLYAGQLIELAGLKNYHDKTTGMATWKNQALVLVNESAEKTVDLLKFKHKVVSSVHAAFGITLTQEPEYVNG